MTILTFTSSERPVEFQIDLPTCCGQKPEVVTWKRKKLVGIYCRNQSCANHPNGVLCYDDAKDIQARWEQFRNKEAVAA